MTVLSHLYRRLTSPFEHRDSKETGQLHKVGGRLTLFLKEWLMITSDRWVLEVIQKGYAIEFIQNPPTNWGVKCTPVPVNSEARKVLCQEIQNLLEKNVIVPVPVDQVGQGFYSTFFLVQKKTGGYRPILNLRPLNNFVVRKGFKLDSIRTIKMLLQPGDFTTSLDLKDAYNHILIRESHQRYLRFEFMGNHYQFRALPFGLSSSPRVFCKYWPLS